MPAVGAAAAGTGFTSPAARVDDRHDRESVDDAAQPSVRATVFRVVPGLAGWARGLPAGMVRAEAALVPAGG